MKYQKASVLQSRDCFGKYI